MMRFTVAIFPLAIVFAGNLIIFNLHSQYKQFYNIHAFHAVMGIYIVKGRTAKERGLGLARKTKV